MSLWGIKTLAIKPGHTTHAGVQSDLRYNVNISKSLIRFSTGVESTEDLIEDIDRVLDKIY